MTNLEGRILLRRRALPPPDGVLDDLQMLTALAERLGRGKYFSADARTVFAELRQASAGGAADYAGVTYERIERQQGVFWPCPDESHPGTPRLFTERFPTPDGRARFTRVDHREPADQTDDEYPYLLTTGRLMQHYQSGAQTRRVRSLVMAQPEPFVEMHPDLGRAVGVAAGEFVELRSRRGTAVMRARFTDTVRPDTVFAPFHWGGGATINDLTDPTLDPTSRMPAFKVCAVAVRRLDPQPD